MGVCAYCYRDCRNTSILCCCGHLAHKRCLIDTVPHGVSFPVCTDCTATYVVENIGPSPLGYNVMDFVGHILLTAKYLCLVVMAVFIFQMFALLYNEICMSYYVCYIFIIIHFSRLIWNTVKEFERKIYPSTYRVVEIN